MKFKVSQFEPKTLSWWYSQRKKIDMNPTYQRRGNLWSVRDKGFLIDSILNDFDIPKVYIADFSFASTRLNQKNLPYAIIDGKQRFETIFEFMSDKLPLNKDFIYFEAPKLNLAGLTYSNLRQNYAEIAEKVEQFHLTVVRVVTDDENKINEMFVRLNRNKPLTGAEIRNAMVGSVPEIIREAIQHPFFTQCINFKVIRGQDKNTAAKLLLFEFHNGLCDTKRRQLDALVGEWDNALAKRTEAAKDRLSATLGKMQEVFSHADTLLSSAGSIPVFYWMIRDLPTEVLPRVRPFLVQFEKELLNQRKKTKAKEATQDKELAVYQDANRSTNDQGSYARRVDVLLDRFKRYSMSQRKHITRNRL